MDEARKTKLWDFFTLLLSDIIDIDNRTQYITTQSGNKSPLENQYKKSFDYVRDILGDSEEHNVKSDMVTTIAAIFDDYETVDEVLEAFDRYDVIDFKRISSQDIWKHVDSFPINFWHEKLWPLTDEYNKHI